MKTTTILFAIAAIVALPSCQPSLSSAQASRDNPNNYISRAQHDQRNIQRQDTINEVRTRDAVRHDNYEQVNSPLRTASDAFSNMNGIRYGAQSLFR